jgi:ribosome biogenesis GTPase
MRGHRDPERYQLDDRADRRLDGRVVANHGRHVVVEDAAGQRHACRLFGRRLAPVCGDRVTWSLEAAEGASGLVTEILPRDTVLARTSQRGDAEEIAANLDQLLAVIAPVPAPDFAICDRYLAAAEWAGLAAGVVLNKMDLRDRAGPELDAELGHYASLGYPVVETARTGAIGIDRLARVLAAHTSVLVGQSGVGKSSLTNLLVPGVEAAVNEISRATEEGRHTTTASMLYHLPGGGELIDSPGVRDFSPPTPPPRDVASGFREIVAAGASCRFSNCLHDGEPGCTVAAEAAAGRIPARRLASYRRLLEMARQFDDRRRNGGRKDEPRRPGSQRPRR